MKKLGVFLSLLAIVLGAFALGNADLASATNSTPTPTPSCGTFSYTFSSDSNNGKVDVDFESGDDQIDVTGVNGWTVTLVELDVDNDGYSGYHTYGTGNLNNFNPNPGNDIDSARVTVTKSCATASPTATPQNVNVNVCHKDGQSGNYSHITVSVHSVNDANGLNGHGNHSGDIWAPFTYNNVNYPGQGNYNGYNMTNCNPNATATPTPTVTASPTATATSTATAYPTINPCALLDIQNGCETSTSTPTATPSETIVPTPTATPLVCTGTQHLNADGSKCVDFELGGPSNGGSTGGQVLGASTMAATGNFAETFYQAIMGLGAIFTAKGLKKGKKASK